MRRHLLRRLLDPPPQLPIHPPKHLVRLPPDRLLGRTQMPRHITHEILLLPRRPAQHLPEQRRLHEILVRDR